MTLNRRRFTLLTLTGLALGPAGLATLRAAPAADGLNEGQDYALIDPPQPPASPGRIEVLEFFSYACPHCRTLQPLIKEWAPGLGPDVDFRSVPVTFGRAAWANLARLHYALDQMDELARLDEAIFTAIHDERANLFTDRSIQAWVAEQDLDADAFTAAYDSFAVNVALSRADTLAATYRIDAVPRLIVAGRYVVLANQARTQQDVLAVAGKLVERARAEAARS
ncbi:MAG: thiol:disulfide interchange protein DsbA/DsbL [Chromatiaceae bacterium]|nr:MAG: thiol:disulfide interchange protein DsbA/DsbL [Chromatiaceae bacterium]